LAAYKASVTADEEAGRSSPSDASRRLLEDANGLRLTFNAAAEEFQRATGIPEAVFEALERAKQPFREDRYLLRDVLTVPSTGNLDAEAAAGLEALSSVVDPAWLRLEGSKAYRLDAGYIGAPLHLVSGVRVQKLAERPQRFAQMLLVCADHLNKRSELNFFEAPTVLCEVAALGSRLSELRELGPEASAKFQRLPIMPDEEVSSTVYELLVGTAGVRKGLALEMLTPDRSRPTPDYRLHGVGVPASIECKRRLGLSQYELKEASIVQMLYETIRGALGDRHLSIEVEFSVEVMAVTAQSFSGAVLSLLRTGAQRRQVTTPWGTVAAEPLPYSLDIPRTRLFAPDYLNRVFRWGDGIDWDGLSCEVDSVESILVRSVKNPRCLKWVSKNETAMLKKSRGITSLWGRASQQIPSGDLGFVYIAYPESNRQAVADARTEEIRVACRRWVNRWSMLIGATFINRLYPRAVGVGMPDFIESTMPIIDRGDEHLLSLLPSCVFVHPQNRPD
jgi:hypothetical protein